MRWDYLQGGFRKSDVSLTRTFDYDAQQTLKITDRFIAKGKTKMVGRLHFAPEVEVLECGNAVAILKLDSQSIRIELENVDALKVVESDYYPEFNIVVSRACLEYSVISQNSDVSVTIHWER